MYPIKLLLLVLALVCYVLAATNTPTKFNAIGAGLALQLLAAMVP